MEAGTNLLGKSLPSLRGAICSAARPEQRRSNPPITFRGSPRRWRPFWATAITLRAMTASVLPVFASSRADDLFEKALVKESVQRDLDGAIHIYQQVIDEAHGDRAAAGEARLR